MLQALAGHSVWKNVRSRLLHLRRFPPLLLGIFHLLRVDGTFGLFLRCLFEFLARSPVWPTASQKFILRSCCAVRACYLFCVDLIRSLLPSFISLGFVTWVYCWRGMCCGSRFDENLI